MDVGNGDPLSSLGCRVRREARDLEENETKIRDSSASLISTLTSPARSSNLVQSNPPSPRLIRAHASDESGDLKAHGRANKDSANSRILEIRMPSLSAQFPVCLRRKKRKERKEKGNEAQELLGHTSEESSELMRGSTSIIDRTIASKWERKREGERERERERERKRERVPSAASRHVFVTESLSEAFPDEAICILEQRSRSLAYRLVPTSTELSIHGSEYREIDSRSPGGRSKSQRRKTFESSKLVSQPSSSSRTRDRYRKMESCSSPRRRSSSGGAAISSRVETTRRGRRRGRGRRGEGEKRGRRRGPRLVRG